MTPAYATPAQMVEIAGHSERFWRTLAQHKRIAFHRAPGDKATYWIRVDDALAYLRGRDVEPRPLTNRERAAAARRAG